MQSGLNGILAPVGVGNLRYKPAGVGSRTRTAQRALRDTISVTDFIPERIQADVRTGLSGGTDLQPYIQKAIDHIKTITLDTFKGTGRPALRFPAGLYTAGTLTADKNMAFVGEGKESTLVRLKAGATTSLLILNAENNSASTTDDTNHYVVEGMSLLGNRVDSTTTGTSHGIDCPATAWSITTQYSPSVITRDVEISNFTGSGLFIGDNRNWGLFSNTISRYNNDNGMATYGYDHRFTDCDFGVNKNYGIRFFAGGACNLSGVNSYFNLTNYLINTNVASPIWLSGCSCDGAREHGMIVSSPQAAVSVVSSRFMGNGSSATGTFADIQVTTIEDCKIAFCDFVYDAVTQVDYLVETASVDNLYWVGNNISAGTAPYSVAISNDLTKLSWAGDSRNNFHLRPKASGAAIYNGTTELMRFSSGAISTLASSRFAPLQTLNLVNGANNDVALPSGENFFIAGPTGAFSLSGLTGGADGRIIRIINTIGAGNFTIVNNATSTAANRLFTMTNADVVLTAAGGSCATFVYSGINSLWMLISTQG